ncbi:DUF4350 domain-containing protein [Streptomyces sp. NBC_00091]|uniref:DUF4350 domain-containing protein n=1 Tax=Streptomyces sp. NBC_00091 TaxID=2975648 RepID=UPI002251E2FE|nr:DUF4350 domain-containing protein [Streptomyces sp. NBC_00091]MCX5378055.1 DUF4350 domain-containing protein [Streptomyces sp. NBC_00091]
MTGPTSRPPADSTPHPAPAAAVDAPPHPAPAAPDTTGTHGTDGAPTPPPHQGKDNDRSATTPGTSTALTGAQLWTRARGLLLGLGILLAAAVALAGLQAGDHHGRLDPRSADRDGSRALAQLLKERGVTTRVVTNADEAAAAAGPRTTLLVTDPDLLGEPQRRAIRSAIDLSGGRTVLIAPSGLSLPDLAPATRTKSFAHQNDLDPGCALPAATTAGRAGTGDGLRYTTDRPGATACYPSDGHPTLLVLPSTTKGGDTVLLGSERILLNQRLAEQGNASLALQLLGSRPDLVWYLPTLADMPADGPAEEKSLLDLVPAGWLWALLQLFVAAALAALWRARRLGPLVTENLPVAIRASETTEGRARLYRKASARDRAATVLRTAARERLAALVGVPPAQAHDPATLVPAVSARLPQTAAGHDAATTLFGTTPADDAALVALADHLDALEREVRTS